MPDLVDLTGYESAFQFVRQFAIGGMGCAAVLHFLFWPTGTRKWSKWMSDGE